MIGPSVDPPGSQAIAHWAMARGVTHQVRPDQSWFRTWEPYDTMVSPCWYLNSCSWAAHPGNVCLTEIVTTALRYPG